MDCVWSKSSVKGKKTYILSFYYYFKYDFFKQVEYNVIARVSKFYAEVSFCEMNSLIHTNFDYVSPF